MNTNYEILIDPSTLDKVLVDTLILEENVPKFIDSSLYNIDKAISYLPAQERDIFKLTFQGKSQMEIGEILCLTQRTISYRLKRGKERLKYFLYLSAIDFEQTRKDLSEILTEVQLDVTMGILTTSSQTTVAKLLGVSQSMVRWRFFSAMEAVKKASERNYKYQPYIQLFELTKSWFRIFKRDFILLAN
jgi:DNA-directed RNA polymerase specialized sigma24 family protein